jgi:hypothetical protein
MQDKINQSQYDYVFNRVDKKRHDESCGDTVLDAVFDASPIKVSALPFDLFFCLINKVDVPMFDKQQC